jgi:hypothetical protein
MLITLMMEVELDEKFDDVEEMPDEVTTAMDLLLTQMEECAHKCSIVDSISDNFWEES